MDDAARIGRDLDEIRKQAPLIHNITNYVVMNNTANALLAIGASPVMAHAEEEVEQMVGYAGALVINIGTLSPAWIRAMRKAQAVAHRNGTPVIIDPVGAGATSLRTNTMRELMQTSAPTVIRGNASEIIALQTDVASTKGVDSQHAASDAEAHARALSAQTGAVVCVSGATDLIIAGDRTWTIQNGHPLMPRVTGLGCTATALIGAFCAVNASPAEATAHAMAVMGIAGEVAGADAKGPGTLQLLFLDALHTIDATTIAAHLQWTSP